MRFDIGLEHEVLGDDNAHGPAGAHRDCRLDVELTLDKTLSRPVGGLLNALAQRPDKIALGVAERELGADPKDCGKSDALEKLPGVEINLVLEAGIAGGIGRRQILDHDGIAVRQDDAGPDQQRAFLSERNDVVILADEAGALRDQEMLARDGVKLSIGVQF